MPDEYRKDQIHRVAVPEWHPQAGGFTRTWELKLLEPVSQEGLLALNEVSDHLVKAVVKTGANSRSLVVETTTTENPHSDEVFYASAYRMLRRIDAIAPIEQIQGQPKQLWQPFRQG